MMSDGAACKSKVLYIQAARRGKRYVACCVVTFRRCSVMALLIGGRRNSSNTSTVRGLGADLGAILSDHDYYLYIARYPPVSVEDIRRVLFPSSYRSNLDK